MSYDQTMLTATADFRDRTLAAAMNKPPRKPRSPIFIADAVTPFAGETLLLCLFRRELDDLQDGRDDRS